MSLNDDYQIDDHLLSWVNVERQATMSQPQLYSLEQITQSHFIQQILNFLDQGFFPIGQSEEKFQIFQKIQVYLDKQLGKRLVRTVRKDILHNERGDKFLKLVLFLCVQSKQKNHFINRIMSLPSTIQNKLMEDIQQISESLENALEIKEILKQMEVLQEQNQTLKNQVRIFKEDEAKYQRCIKDWQQQFQKLNTESEKYRKQKQKVIESLQLIDIDDYTELFRKVQQQNLILNYSVQDYEQKNYVLNEFCQQMKRQIKENTTVIAEQNQQITRLKDLYTSLKLQKSYQDTIDATRSFGKVIENNMPFPTSRIKKKKRSPKRSASVSDCGEDIENMKEIIPLSLKDTSNQLQQIRKYNSEIMQKLESSYKNINTMNQQVSIMRQKNNRLAKQLKFYKKQLNDINQIHRELEINFINGEI